MRYNRSFVLPRIVMTGNPRTLVISHKNALYEDFSSHGDPNNSDFRFLIHVVNRIYRRSSTIPHHHHH